MNVIARFARRHDLTCRRAVELITDYLDKALPGRQRADVERHLSRCPHCSEYLRQLKATIMAIGRVDSDQLSPDVKNTLILLYRRNEG
ncbi:MAG: anti-sigma factor [Frankiales bacterium]|nr:anti-sigma factor [Frankiales bacterium]